MSLLLIPLVVSIGLIGWPSYLLLVRDPPEETPAAKLGSFFLIFCTGFGVASLILFVLAVIGRFTIPMISIVTICVVLLCLFRIRSQSLRYRFSFSHYFLFCIALGCLSTGIGKVNRPYSPVIMGNDASIYLATAFQLGQSGGLFYQDELVRDMKEEERKPLLLNRWDYDSSGLIARFPGGVRILDSSRGIVSFSFYHLHPVWLALSYKILGDHAFLDFLGFFCALSLMSLFFLGTYFGGILVGASLPLLLFVSYPQMYFAAMPSSEILCQALFLCGLWALVSGWSEGNVMPVGRQIVVGILWGATFLTRLDAWIFIWLSLIFAFSVLPSLARSVYHWRHLFVTLLIFTVLAIYHQLRTQEYMYFSLVFGWHPITYFLEQSLRKLSHLLLKAPRFIDIAVAILCAAVVILSNTALTKRILSKKILLRSLLGILFVPLFIFLVVRYDTGVWQLRDQIHLISFYIPPVLVVMLLAGALLFFSSAVSTQQRPVRFFVIVLFLIPAVCYLFRPLVDESQRWADFRRYVPFTFPLFFLVALCGWWDFLKARLLSHRLLPLFSFLILVSCGLVLLSQKTKYLLNEPLFNGLIPQIKQIARKIPENALVVLPTSSGGTHLQTALQYLGKRQTLLLPIQKEAIDSSENLIVPYLKRQMEKRPVFVLLINAPNVVEQAYLLYKNLSLNLQFQESISFRMLPPFKYRYLQAKSIKTFLHLSLFKLGDPKTLPEKSLITYDDPDVYFLSFHLKEPSGFRWTQKKSELSGFVFHTQRQRIALILSVFPWSIYQPQEMGLKLGINEMFYPELIKADNEKYYFSLDCSSIPVITSVTIASKTFIPSMHAKSKDTRELGVAFRSLTFARENGNSQVETLNPGNDYSIR